MSISRGLNSEAGQGDVPSLNQLYFYLTEGCNLACRHCWLAPKFDATGSQYPTLPVELFETAIREAKPLGLRSIKLTGGEPLLHPEFLKLLEIVRRQDLELSLETNGTLCTPEVAAAIARCRKRFVSVSIDGVDADTHDWVRGVPGSFELARQAVHNLSATGTSPQIIMSLLRRNADQVGALVRLAEELGAASLKFNVVQPTARGENLHETDITLDVEELINLGRHVEMVLAPSTRLRLFFDYPLAFRPLSRIANGDGNGACRIFGILGVIPSGHYALCGIGQHVPELVFGKVGQDRLEEVWQESATLRALRAAGGTTRSAYGYLRTLSDEAPLPGVVRGPELLSHEEPLGTVLVLRAGRRGGSVPTDTPGADASSSIQQHRNIS